MGAKVGCNRPSFPFTSFTAGWPGPTFSTIQGYLGGQRARWRGDSGAPKGRKGNLSDEDQPSCTSSGVLSSHSRAHTKPTGFHLQQTRGAREHCVFGVGIYLLADAPGTEGHFLPCPPYASQCQSSSSQWELWRVPTCSALQMHSSCRVTTRQSNVAWTRAQSSSSPGLVQASWSAEALNGRKHPGLYTPPGDAHWLAGGIEPLSSLQGKA